ncbi:MAG: CHAT domain-containing protein, partial [Phaeodactylibacter sp.]|nr:CHAT domain-containing protein [Phaeodactylibacter sp.]
LTPSESPELSGRLNNLGIALQTRYERLGGLNDLERCIQSYRQALDQSTLELATSTQLYSNLGLALTTRYYRTGALVDLQQAIQAHETAIAQTPEGSTALPDYLINLGLGLSVQYERTKSLADLERTIRALEKSLKLISPTSTNLPTLLNMLGIAWRYRFERSGKVADLERSIEVLKEAIQKTPPDSPRLLMAMTNLSGGLRFRFHVTKTLQDLKQGIEVLQKALERTEPTSPDWPVRLNNLGSAMKDLYQHSGKPADLKKAIQCYRQAAESSLNVATSGSLNTAATWGNWAFERQSWDEAVEAYHFARRAADQLVQIQLVRRSKEIWLQDVQGLADRSAYVLAKVGDYKEAALALEQGSARLLADALGRDRADLERLKESSHPELVEEYHQAVGRWRELLLKEQHPRPGTLSDAQLTEALQSTRAELDGVIANIRQVPGYERFLEPPTFEDLSKAARNQPLVYITSTTAGGLALLLHPGSPVTVNPVWLPSLSNRSLREILGDYFDTYNQWKVDPGNRSLRDTWFASLDRTTRWLWDAVMEPLSAVLEPYFEVSLIPVGFLGLLPLHAAWTEDSEAPSGRRYALDARTYIYAPNARSLHTARAIASRLEADTILAVDNPQPVTASSLPNSRREVQAAISTFSKSQTFRQEEATREAVLTALKDYHVLHFSCHGYANLTRPLTGGLVMAHDEPLSLQDLLNLQLTDTKLAVLSACETGMPGTELPDEVVSLPTGLLQAGAASVVASSWSVADISTMMLMFRFYHLWRKEGLQPSEALRKAQIWLRNTTNEEKAVFFKDYLVTLPDSQAPADAVDSFIRSLATPSIQTSDFAHPFHWAAFKYVGG